MRTNDVESEIVVPGQAVEPDATVTPRPPAFAFVAREPLCAVLVEAVPLPDELADVRPHIRLKLEHAFLGEYVRHDLAFTCMLMARAGVEEAALDGDEGVVEIRLQCAVAMSVHDGQCVRVRDRDMVRRNANELSYA